MMRLKVRELAEQAGINRSQISRRADLSLTTLNEIWDGTRVDVRLSTLKAISGVLGVKIADLIDEDAPDVEPAGEGAPGAHDAPGRYEQPGAEE